MSAPRVPYPSQLPGIASLQPALDAAHACARFTDRHGAARTIRFMFGQDDDGAWLTLCDDDQSICTFNRCPSPNESFWWAGGLVVQVRRCGIASHIYAVARDLLAQRGAAITPSANLFPDGVALWSHLDPSAPFREQTSLPGYFELDYP